MLAKRTNFVPAPKTLFSIYLLFNLLMLIGAQPFSMIRPEDALFSQKLAVFGINVYSELLQLKPNENIVFSPFSIQTCAAMARIGAEGETAAQLDAGLGLVSNNVDAIADAFHNILSSYENSGILKIANKIYVAEGYSVLPSYNEILSKKFFSSADQINFKQNVAAANTINSWIESKTNNLIRDFIPADALDEYTRLVLLNAIHFKGQWVHKFEKQLTRNDNFYLTETNAVQVPMMYNQKSYYYADLPDLDATALQMDYKDSDLSMLVILPNSRTGLKSLEKKLKTYAISDITNQLGKHEVNVKFPKFKIEFEVELNEAFKNLHMARIFTNQAEFGKMLDSNEKLAVSKILHKAFIDVNEEGTEAAAVTGISVNFAQSARIPQYPPKIFYADKPFLYFIKNIKGVTLFAGNIVKF